MSNSSGFDTADIIQTGDNDGNQQDTTSIQAKPRTYFVNMASSDTLTPKFYITNWGQKVIIGGGSYDTSEGGDTYGFQCDNLIVANGGTIGGGSFCESTGSFSNAGGMRGTPVWNGTYYNYSGSAHERCLTNWLVTQNHSTKPTSLTLETWMYGLNTAKGNNYLMNKFIIFGEMVFWSNKLYFSYYDGGTSWQTNQFKDFPDAVANMFDDAWNHVAVTVDATTTTHDAKLYLNGKLIDNIVQSATNTAFKVMGTDSGRIGSATGGDEIGSLPFNGMCDSIRMWNTVRTPEEIRNNMFNSFADLSAGDKTDIIQAVEFDWATTALQASGASAIVSSGGAADNTMALTLQVSADAITEGYGEPSFWSEGGTWTAGGTLSSSAGTLTIGNRGTDATIFASSKFVLNHRTLTPGAKFVSKAHEGTPFYYIDTSGTSDYLTYQKLTAAPIGSSSDLYVLADSYFTFDSTANNEQCNTFVNLGGSYIRIVNNSDFYTQDFDNQGTWLRQPDYHGTIHDDGSTPHEYNPIDIMDDLDSGFDTEDLID